MSDENEEEEILLPAASKCNTCKHGMCILDQDIQSIVQPTKIEGNSFEGMGEEEGFSQTSFEMKKTRSICFWRPEGVAATTPIIFSVISECSRYEKRSR